jgi:hypothetical protein
VQEAPLADGRRGVKDSDGPPRRTLQLRVTAEDWYDGQLPSCVRVFLPLPDDPDKFVWSGGSVTENCARQLVSEGQATLMRTGRRMRGIRPVFGERERVKRVILRGASVGRPRLSGPTWTQGTLPNWAWHEVFYQVMNSCRGRPFQPWTWEEIVAASRQARQTRRANVIEMPKRPSWRETLAKRIVA